MFELLRIRRFGCTRRGLLSSRAGLRQNDVFEASWQVEFAPGLAGSKKNHFVLFEPALINRVLLYLMGVM